MKDHGLLLFILALPALAVLGHDSYLAYTNTQYELAERFYLSDLGCLWNGPDSPSNLKSGLNLLTRSWSKRLC